jgi:hypothetical protein
MRDRLAPRQVAADKGGRWRGVVAPEQIWGQPTVKLSRPSGSSAWTSTAVTRASGGPWRHHSTNLSNASGSPSATISTRPSGRLRAQPEMPSARACSAQLPRYQTPCTLPLTQRCRLDHLQKLAAVPYRGSSGPLVKPYFETQRRRSTAALNRSTRRAPNRCCSLSRGGPPTGRAGLRRCAYRR